VEPGIYVVKAQLSPLQVYMSRGIAGVFTRTLLAPIDVVQTIKQVGPKKNQKRTITEEFEEIQEKEGFKGFFKGNLVGCMRFVATGALQVVVYIGLKKLLASKEGTPPTPSTVALCTSLSGLIALFLTYPLETIKTRLILDKNKSQYTSALDCLQAVIMEEGWGRLWRGVLPFLIGTFIADDILERVWANSLMNIQNLTVFHSFFFSCLATLVAQTFYYPIDTTLKMVQSECKGAPKKTRPDVDSESTLEATVQNVEKHGIAGLFRGYQVNLLTIVPGSLIAGISFEACKRLFGYFNTNYGGTRIIPL